MGAMCGVEVVKMGAMCAGRSCINGSDGVGVEVV